MEGLFNSLEQLPNKASDSLGSQKASIVGLVGMLVAIYLASVLVIMPVSKLAYGAPYVHNPKTAAHALPNTRLGKLGRKYGNRVGVASYATSYLTSYFVPYLFAAKFKQIDLLLLLVRTLLCGLLALFSVRLFFLQDSGDTPSESNQPA